MQEGVEGKVCPTAEWLDLTQREGTKNGHQYAPHVVGIIPSDFVQHLLQNRLITQKMWRLDSFERVKMDNWTRQQT